MKKTNDHAEPTKSRTLKKTIKKPISIWKKDQFFIQTEIQKKNFWYNISLPFFSPFFQVGNNVYGIWFFISIPAYSRYQLYDI